MFFRYLQLHHAYLAQFPIPVTLTTRRAEYTLGLKEGIKPLSTLYSDFVGLDTFKVTKLFYVWQTDVPALADDWEEGIQQYLPLMISARDRYIQLKFMHRAHYTPECLAKIYPTRSSICPKCETEMGSFHPRNLVLPTNPVLLGEGAYRY